MSRANPLKPMTPPPNEGQVIWLTVRLSPGPTNLFRVQSIYQDGQYFAVQDISAGPIPGEYIGWTPSS